MLSLAEYLVINNVVAAAQCALLALYRGRKGKANRMMKI